MKTCTASACDLDLSVGGNKIPLKLVHQDMCCVFHDTHAHAIAKATRNNICVSRAPREQYPAQAQAQLFILLHTHTHTHARTHARAHARTHARTHEARTCFRMTVLPLLFTVHSGSHAKPWKPCLVSRLSRGGWGGRGL